MIEANAYYHSKLGVRFYDVFTADADMSGLVRGDVDFYVECARELGAPVLEFAKIGAGLRRRTARTATPWRCR